MPNYAEYTSSCQITVKLRNINRMQSIIGQNWPGNFDNTTCTDRDVKPGVGWLRCDWKIGHWLADLDNFTCTKRDVKPRVRWLISWYVIEKL